MHGGLANKMKSCSSSERVQAGVGHLRNEEAQSFNFDSMSMFCGVQIS